LFCTQFHQKIFPSKFFQKISLELFPDFLCNEKFLPELFLKKIPGTFYQNFFQNFFSHAGIFTNNKKFPEIFFRPG